MLVILICKKENHEDGGSKYPAGFLEVTYEYKNTYLRIVLLQIYARVVLLNIGDFMEGDGCMWRSREGFI